MINRFIISANLTNTEADNIKLYLDGLDTKWHHKTSSHYSTNYFRYCGFDHIRLTSFGKDFVIGKAGTQRTFYKKLNTLSITVNAIHKLITTSRGINEPYIIDQIYEIFPILRRQLSFKLRRLDVSIEITGSFISEYPRLISKGFSYKISKPKDSSATINSNSLRNNLHLSEPNTGANTKPFLIDIENNSVKMTIMYQYEASFLSKQKCISLKGDSSNCLRLSLQLKKPKIYELMQKHHIASRTLHAFLPQISAIEKSMFLYYISQITGTGTYYSINYAEYIISASKFNKPKKEKLIHVLKHIAKYQGISHFIDHVNDQDEEIKYIGKMSTIQTYLNNLQEIGINPVTISRRMNAEEQFDNHVTYKTLPNITELIEAYYLS